MAIQYLLVSFAGDRKVLADGNAVGVTNHTLMLPAGEYDITLEGDSTAPSMFQVPLTGTSVLKPKVVSFLPTSSMSTATESGTVGTAPEVVAAKPKLKGSKGSKGTKHA